MSMEPQPLSLGLAPEDEAALLALVKRRSTPILKAARAVEDLGDRLPLELAEATLRRALDRRQKALAKACLERLAAVSEPRFAQLYWRALEVFPEGKIAARAARALARLGASAGPSVEALWLKVLERKPGRRVALIAARALGKVGTAAAVMPLRQLETRGLVEVAQKAIAEIHGRLPAAGHGQLSLAAGEAGALTLARAEEPGRLSFADAAPPPER